MYYIANLNCSIVISSKNANYVKVNSSIPSFIPIKESFTYLGITIYKNIHKIARDNFNNILVKIKNDIQDGRILKSLSKEESPLLR